MAAAWHHRSALYFGLVILYVAGSTGGCTGDRNPRFQEKGIANHQKAFCLYRII